MINRYKPHLIVVPEDRANEEIINGFVYGNNINKNALQIERPSGGWKKVIKKFKTDLAPDMQKVPSIVVLIIDFDGVTDRLASVQSEIPDDVKNRVFVLGAKYNPELLRKDLGKSFEQIGEELAKDCPENQSALWGHEQLKHNQPELERMILSVKTFLFN